MIAENAIEYNCDLVYETNRIICHRARALQDFAYALVKAEMDTDFEDECKEIHRRRKETSEKLQNGKVNDTTEASHLDTINLLLLVPLSALLTTFVLVELLQLLISPHSWLLDRASCEVNTRWKRTK